MCRTFGADLRIHEGLALRLPGIRLKSDVPLGEFSTSGATPRPILRPRAISKYQTPIKLADSLGERFPVKHG